MKLRAGASHAFPKSLVLVICGALMNTACAPEAKQVASEFFDSLEAKDLEGVMSVLAPEFRLLDGSGAVVARRSDMPVLLGWDLQAAPMLRVGRMRVSGDTVRVEVVEENDFTRHLGLKPWTSEVTLVVRDGLITEERIAEADERSFPAEFAEAIQPILSWAEEHAPYHRAAVDRPEGMQFDAPTARALLELIRLYQARQACGPEMQ